MVFVISWVFLALLMLVPVTAAAQEILTIDTAVHTALAHNASLRAIRAGTDQIAARATEIRSGFYPRISFSEAWQRGNEPLFVFGSLLSARRVAANSFAIDVLNHPDSTGFFRASLGLEQLVFDGGRLRSAAAGADLRRTAAAASIDDAAASLAVTTTETFGRIVIADAAQRAANAGLAAAQEDVARAGRRRDAGMATDADVLALMVHVADLQQRAIQAGGDAAEARAELNRLMGNPIETTLQVMEPSSSSLGEFEERPNVAALLAEADAARPEIRRAAASTQAAAETRRQARAAFVPQVTAQAALDVAGTRVNDRASSWIVGGELRWTLSSGGAEQAGVRAAAAAIAQAQAEAEEARAAVHVDVIRALQRLDTARARQEAGRTAVEEARESQRIIRDRFEAGMAPVNDVLHASTAVLDADASRVAALVDGLVARASLRRALGRTP